MTREQSKGLRYAGIALAVFVAVVALLTAPPNSVLRNPQTRGVLSGSPFVDGLIVQISALFFAVSFAYGKGAGTVENLTQAIGMVVKTLRSFIVIFVLIVLLLDILITGAVVKWAIFAPVFIPLFMRLGGEPDLVLAAYRVGDSPMNVITPLNVYLGVMVGFAAKYQKDAGIGTVVSLMLPYTAILAVVWTLLLIGWYLLGLPLGPA